MAVLESRAQDFAGMSGMFPEAMKTEEQIKEENFNNVIVKLLQVPPRALRHQHHDPQPAQRCTGIPRQVLVGVRSILH